METWGFSVSLATCQPRNRYEYSGAGTRISTWGTPVRSESGGTDPAQSAGKFFLGRVPPLFGSKSTISCFGERFRDGQYS